MKAKNSVFYLAMIATTLMVSFSACKKDNDAPEMAKTLYDSLGGTTMVSDPRAPGTMIEQGRLGIRSVVDSTVFVIAADPQINSYFQVLLAEVTNGNLSGFAALSKSLTDFLCVGTGAKNFTYNGLSMAAAHDPARNPRMNGKADNAAFDRFIADVVIGAQKNGLPNQLIGRVGEVLNSLRGPIVQR